MPESAGRNFRGLRTRTSAHTEVASPEKGKLFRPAHFSSVKEWPARGPMCQKNIPPLGKNGRFRAPGLVRRDGGLRKPDLLEERGELLAVGGVARVLPGQLVAGIDYTRDIELGANLS